MTIVLIAGETENGSLSGVTGELVAASAKAAFPDVDVSVALLGGDVSAAAEGARRLGVQRVYAIEHELLADGGEGGFDAPVSALGALCRDIQPAVVLFAKTDFGSNVGPRVAFRLGVGFAQDCMDIAWDAEGGRVVVTRPVYGGNALAVFRFGVRDPQMASIRPGAFDSVKLSNGSAEVVRFDASDDFGDVKARLVDTVVQASAGVRLEDAEVVISGGRGLGGPEPFEKLSQLASLLNGAVGASRAACDAGWVDHSYQIGLTGKSIRPRVYITFGISGASQHMAGCSGAKSVVAINKDADANIFKEARFGVVGDWERVLSGFMATVEEFTGG